MKIIIIQQYTLGRNKKHKTQLQELDSFHEDEYLKIFLENCEECKLLCIDMTQKYFYLLSYITFTLRTWLIDPIIYYTVNQKEIKRQKHVINLFMMNFKY